MNKKLLKNIFSIGTFCLLNVTLFAQTPIPASGLTPKVGDKFVVNTGSYVEPGAGGLNQSWYLDKIEYLSQNEFRTELPINMGVTSKFPEASVVLANKAGNFIVKNTSTEMINLGFSMSGVDFVYSDHETLLKFPLTYNDNFTDKWGGSIDYGNGLTTYRIGTTTAHVDGFGTLYTPDGVFQNAYRVKFKQLYTDSMTMSGFFVQKINYENNQYSWYVNGIHYSVAQIFEFNADNNSVKQSTYLNYNKTNLTDNLLSETKIFPNPCTNKVNVKSITGNNVKITDLAGKIVLEKSISINEVNEIELNNLNPSLYLLTIYNNDEIVSQEKISIQ